jgi:glucose/arabinose dehydrogenase/mono/diheme cytochrome c family protein
MKDASRTKGTAGLLLCLLASLALAPSALASGTPGRVLWTASRVVGSPDPPFPYRVRRVFERLKIPCPIAVAHEPGANTLLVLHQAFPWGGAGRVLRVKDDPSADTFEVLLDLDSIAYGLAFHPDYRKNGYLFVGANGPMKGKKKTRVSRYTVARTPPYACDPKSEKVIIEWPSDGHNGGDLAFGADGMLYVTSGDGTSDSDTNHAGQDLSRLLSKVLRIDVDHAPAGRGYAIPADNPFLNTKGARPETWAYGFRNPWRLHVDRPSGDVWVGQNGQDLWEQVYLVARGANYGWSVVEGGHPFYPDRKRGPTPISKPLIDHPHSEMRSLTGGVVYHGARLPALRGAYVYGDWSTGRIWGVRHKAGKVTWHQELARTTLQITGFGTDSRGELLIADHGGGFYRLEPTPPGKKAPPFPARLSDTGLYTSAARHQTHPGLIPYSVNAPLWSDGADKERFIALPGPAQIDFTASRGWNFPDGSVLVKTFSLDTPAGKRRVETRLMTRQLGQWAGYSYAWNDEQTDAALVGAAGAERAYEVRDAGAAGGRRRQTWRYPSRVECMACHSRAANYVLGLSTLQTNKVYLYGKTPENQLHALERMGVFRVNAAENAAGAKQQAGLLLDSLEVLAAPLDALTGALRPPAWRQAWAGVRRGALQPLEALEDELRRAPRFSTTLPQPPGEYGRLVDPSDVRQPLDLRARSYLHANCAACHVEAGGGNAKIDLEFTTPAARRKLVDVRPLHDTFGVPGAAVIRPGEPTRSTLYLRVSRRGAGQMPPLATSAVDAAGARLIHDWIKAMKPGR